MFLDPDPSDLAEICQEEEEGKEELQIAGRFGQLPQPGP
jgi:hypothetical protein